LYAYRVHPRGESPNTVLKHNRPDGWKADDESYLTQPHGISATTTISDLLSYIRRYGMAIRRGDLLLEMEGVLSGEDDRDPEAIRFLPRKVVVIGEAWGLLEMSKLKSSQLRDLFTPGTDLTSLYLDEETLELAEQILASDCVLTHTGRI